MKTKKNQVTVDQSESVRNRFKDPVTFASQILRANLWAREIEILRSIRDHRRTAIKAAHGTGKTFTLAHAVLWWLVRYLDGIVLTTAPTFRQVETQLWREIHQAAARSKFSFPQINATRLRFRGDDNIALGLATNRSENFQGYHGRHLLIIADEAPGLESGIWDAIAGAMAGGQVHVVMAGNPILPEGAFYDAFGRECDLWNCITINAFDSPNLQGLSLEQLLQMDPAEGGRLDQNPVPYLATRRWVYDQYPVWWHGDEASSPNWVSRVLAQFPEQAQNALIKMSWLERAKQSALVNSINESRSVPLIAGVDVGAGEAETVVYVCESTHARHKIIRMGAWRAEDTLGYVVNFLNEFRDRLCLVRVDAIGVGHNFGLRLRERRFPVEMINVSMPCESKSQLGENDPARRFANLRACLFQTLADAFERNQIEGLTDGATIGQLAGIRYEFDTHGRIKIESKENARARGVRSPDRADALMLALSKPYQKIEFYTTHDLHRLRSRSAEQTSREHPYWGFTEVPGDDDEVPESFSRQLERHIGKLRWPRGGGAW